MAKPSKTETPTPKTPEPEVSDLPVIPFLSMHRTPKGYVVLRIKVQGRKVVDEEILTEGAVPRPEAENVLRVETVKHYIYPRDIV